MPTYRVATFYHWELAARGKPTLSSITAYTRWFNEEWKGCVMIEVVAKSGTEAKAIARRIRLEMELQRRMIDMAEDS